MALFDRAGRGLVLTEAGRQLLPHVRGMADAAARIPLTASGQSQDLAGTVSITASDTFATKVLPSVIADLTRLAPELEIEVISANDLRDIARRESDIAIRHVRPTDPQLTARLLGHGSAHLFAASSYLDLRGRPKSLDDLATHDFIGFADIPRMVETLNATQIPVTARNFRTRTDSGLAMWEMIRAGLGIGLMTADIALTTTDTELLLRSEVDFRFPYWLVTHRELHSARRIRHVYDHLAEAITAHIRRTDARMGRGA